MKTIELTINDLDDIIQKARKCRSAFIVKAEIGSMGNQFKTHTVELGAGACLTLTVEVSR